MDPVDFLRRQGGLSTARALVGACGRDAVGLALAGGLVVRTGRGRYALPQLDIGLRTAHGMSGVLSHESAAAWWGWEAKQVPTTPVVTVPHDRKPRDGTGADLSYRDLTPADVVAPGVTGAVRTVLDCATRLPFDEALAIADSALRHGQVLPEELRLSAAASASRGRGLRRRVARYADARSANPFESVLRARAIDCGLDVEPQVWLRTSNGWVRPDLLDARRGVAIEAESFTWHGQRDQLTRDCRKYNDLTLLGLALLRFSWEHVMLSPSYVDEVLLHARTGIAPWNGAGVAASARQRRSA